jgi:lactate permease
VGNPIRTLVAVTGLGEADISGMIGRILPVTALVLPFWLIRSVTGWSNVLPVWPGLLLCGGVFAAVQFYWSNFRDAGLVDIMGGMITLVALAVFFRFWKPKSIWRYAGEADAVVPAHKHSALQVLHAWSPFLLLSAFVVLWGMPPVKRVLDRTSVRFEMPGLHQMVQRVAPVVDKPRTEPAVAEADWLAAVGTATFIAGLIAGPLLGLSMSQTLKVFLRTCYRMRISVLAIAAMIGLGFVTRYCGMDAVMGLAMTHTGALFPFFGTLIGWLGVALSGTDAGSNALFGSLQMITANRLGLSPVLMAAANSAGGVMGKMISAQSIVIACAAVGEQGKEGDIFRKILPHSIALAALVGLIVYFYAYYGQQWIPNGRVWR